MLGLRGSPSGQKDVRSNYLFLVFAICCATPKQAGSKAARVY